MGANVHNFLQFQKGLILCPDFFLFTPKEEILLMNFCKIDNSVLILCHNYNHNTKFYTKTIRDDFYSKRS